MASCQEDDPGGIAVDMPDDWTTPIDPSPRYRLCRASFALGALSLGLLALDSLCHLFAMFDDGRDIRQVLDSPAWEWLVGAPITWGSLIGSILLIGRFDDRLWRRKAVLLALLNSVDLAFWCVDHSQILGLGTIPPNANVDAARLLASPFTNLFELILYGDLAAELLIHLGRNDLLAARKIARLSAWFGMAFWLFFVLQVLGILHAGGPMGRRALFAQAVLASTFAQTVASFAVTFLCANACVQCSTLLTELDREKKERDPFA